MELDSTPPTSGEEDYTVWAKLLNVAISLWENEEGVLWKELFVKLSSAATGDKTIAANDYSYALPTDFRFPASGYVWTGSGATKTPIRIISPGDIQLYENNTSGFAYYVGSSLEFNPNSQLTTGQTINYNYYKFATALTSGSSTFEMSDPMFAVYYALAELTKEEGNAEALSLATQKLEAMKTRNEMTAGRQEDSLINPTEGGLGY